MHGSIPPVLPIKKETCFHPFLKVSRAVQYVNICVQSKLQNRFFCYGCKDGFTLTAFRASCRDSGLAASGMGKTQTLQPSASHQ